MEEASVLELPAIAERLRERTRTLPPELNWYDQATGHWLMDEQGLQLDGRKRRRATSLARNEARERASSTKSSPPPTTPTTPRKAGAIPAWACSSTTRCWRGITTSPAIPTRRPRRRKWNSARPFMLSCRRPASTTRWCGFPPMVLNIDGHREGKAWTDFAANHAGKLLVKDFEYEPFFEIYRRAALHPCGLCSTPTPISARSTSAGGIRSRLAASRPPRPAARRQSDRRFQNHHGDDRAGFRERHRPLRLSPASGVLSGRRVRANRRRPAVRAVRDSQARPYTIRFYDLSEEVSDARRSGDSRRAAPVESCIDSGEWVPPEYGEIATLAEPKWLSFSEAWSL